MTNTPLNITNTCWLCNSSDTRLWKAGSHKEQLHSIDLQITDKRYGNTLTLYRCQTCGFIFCSDRALADLVSLYSNLEDPGYEESQEPRSIQMSWLIKKIKQVKSDTESLLDIGAGTGLMVREAEKQNIQAVGVELSKSLVDFGKRNYGVKLYQGLFPHPELKDMRYDVITIVDVIEHVQQPVQLLKDVRKALKKDGIILIVTPDVNSVMAKLFGWKWWHFRLAHVCYFNYATIQRLLNQSGFEKCGMFRTCWFFKTGYLASRMEEYLPVKWINSKIPKIPVLNRLYDITIPLNLYDSWGIIAQMKCNDEE